ncbi:MAG TPA: hypothetical protein VFL62_24095 [Bradyrhizobium sp.]|uniref:hypothetical protein n=1 Tax=Bradyrhizobium sp. TaxID=376 RepID=UPI002D7F3B0F|nr:hypothetical protein [Bradyrhizobium sp.]HET7889323.1 hypothetical protein [Bradyrhizobium sp.]
MMPATSPFHRAQAASARWIAALLVLTAAAWLVVLAGLLAVASRVHDDIPVDLAVKLPLLASHPDLIFGGDSRMLYQVDPRLAAQLLGKPEGSAVNIAYDAGEPLALLAVMRGESELFRNAQVVISVSPFVFNDGARQAVFNPQDVVARLGVFGQMTTYLPLRVSTLIRFIREAFASRLESERHTGHPVQPLTASGLFFLDNSQPENRWPAALGSHPHYAHWDIGGPKARLETGALCDMAKLARKVTVVIPPWAPRYDRAKDAAWREKDDQYVALVTNAGRACGFDVLNIASVPGIAPDNYADEMHVNTSGIPIYTRYLMSRLNP